MLLLFFYWPVDDAGDFFMLDRVSGRLEGVGCKVGGSEESCVKQSSCLYLLKVHALHIVLSYASMQ